MHLRCRSLFIWKTKDAEELEDNGVEETKPKISIYNVGDLNKKSKGKQDEDEDDDDDDFFSKKGGRRKSGNATSVKLVECPSQKKSTRGRKK